MKKLFILISLLVCFFAVSCGNKASEQEDIIVSEQKENPIESNTEEESLMPNSEKTSEPNSEGTQWSPVIPFE